MKRTVQVTAEQSITDGTRPLGHLIAKGRAFEAFGADGKYLCKCETVAEARRAIVRADREHAEALARLDDDGAPAR